MVEFASHQKKDVTLALWLASVSRFQLLATIKNLSVCFVSDGEEEDRVSSK